MRFDTEDLLSLRDGEPIDAERKAELLADTDRALELARLERVKHALRDLPELTPPAGVWDRIAAALDAESRVSRGAARSFGAAGRFGAARSFGAAGRFVGVRRYVAAAACAAVLAAIVSSLLLASGESGRRAAGRGAEPQQVLGPATEREPATALEARTPGPDDATPASYTQLVAESERLERALARLPFRPVVMNAGTAGTIASLEDTLAALDEQITFAAAGGLDTGERRTLWQERVNVMKALVQVRYAAAQRTSY